MSPSGPIYRLTLYLGLYYICISLLANIQSGCTSLSNLRIKKYVCIDAPYQASTLLVCKNIPRRNAPTMVNVSVHVPKLYDNVVVKVILFYKFSTYQPFLITVEGNGCDFIRHPPKLPMEKHVYDVIQETLPELLLPCPAGNRTYNFLWYLQERHSPNNMPPGDYKLQFKLTAPRNRSIFAIEVFIEVRAFRVVSPFMVQ